jgi:hypothetical protein
MEHQLGELLLEQDESVFQRNTFYKEHLYNNSFRGFWFDSGEKSYGIILSFRQKHSGVLSIFAQDFRGKHTVSKYIIESDSFSMESIAYDKVQISISEYTTNSIPAAEYQIKVPEVIEFTLQVLSHNSVYIQFMDYQLFTSPINKLRFGLVLASES